MLVWPRHEVRAMRWLLALLSLAAACESDNDTPPREVVDASSDAGRDAGPDGAAQHPDGGPEDASVDASMALPKPPFRMRLDGRMLVLDTLGHQAWAFKDCSNAFVLEKFGNAWAPLRDERPHDGRGYYLDGKFIREQSVGCEVSCMKLGKTRDIARAEEYVQIGTKFPPPDEPEPTTPVFVVSSQPIAGALRLIVNYFRDSSCGGELQTAVIDTSIPTEGVCCPIGPAECTSPGPGGGWAKSYDMCPVFNTEINVAFVSEADSHGCPVLKQDSTMCCDCMSMDADAGSAVTGTGTVPGTGTD
jgi:hypothetical protein